MNVRLTYGITVFLLIVALILSIIYGEVSVSMNDVQAYFYHILLGQEVNTIPSSAITYIRIPHIITAFNWCWIVINRVSNADCYAK